MQVDLRPPVPQENQLVTGVCFFFFLPHSQHMEVSRLGAEIGAAAASLHSNVGSKPYL